VFGVSQTLTPRHPLLLRKAEAEAVGEYPMFLRGEIDLVNVDDRVAAIRASASSGSGDVIIDCMDLLFIDAAGIGGLVRANNELRAQGRYLRLINPAPLLRRVLDVCNLNDLLDGAIGAAESRAS
jgi:anti-anti-sigma factor